MKKLLLGFFISSIFISCASDQTELPFLGPTQTLADGSVKHHQIPAFSFVNQYGDTVTNADFDGKVYVADFFFTTCPTICPVMKTQMSRIYDKFKGRDDFKILSHTIDPYHDSVQVLNEYAARLGVEGDMWNFVTGTQDSIYAIGQKSYMVTAAADTANMAETGGFIHSGAFILVDKQRHVRGIYDGTVEQEVSQLIRDLELLLNEEDK